MRSCASPPLSFSRPLSPDQHLREGRGLLSVQPCHSFFFLFILASLPPIASLIDIASFYFFLSFIFAHSHTLLFLFSPTFSPSSSFYFLYCVLTSYAIATPLLDSLVSFLLHNPLSLIVSIKADRWLLANTIRMNTHQLHQQKEQEQHPLLPSSHPLHQDASSSP